ncbi:SagB-type dehydrogenase domain-containing protein, partial [filamentous cyanobacterium CCP5]
LYLDPEEEGAIAVLPLADLLAVEQNLPRFRTVLAAPTHRDYPTVADGDLLLQFHRATEMDADGGNHWQIEPESPPRAKPSPQYDFPFCLKLDVTSRPIHWGPQLQGLEDTLLQRRSTRQFSGQTITRAELSALLDFTYQPQHYRDQGLDGSPDYCDLSLLHTFVVVSGVEGLESGCYYYEPNSQELRQVRFKKMRAELHYLCLSQPLGRDAAAVVFHTADLGAAIARYGDRVYRYLHLDAGHLGQRLNLAATRLGLGVSGIAGFFDDQVNEVLGIPVDEAVIYITTLGQPVGK